jgi:hypothetical protein
VLGLVVGLAIHSGSSRTPVGTTSSPTASSLPPGLQRALNDLDRAVGP